MGTWYGEGAGACLLRTESVLAPHLRTRVWREPLSIPTASVGFGQKSEQTACGQSPEGEHHTGLELCLHAFLLFRCPAPDSPSASGFSLRMGTFSLYKTQPQTLVFKQMLELFQIPKEMFHLFHFSHIFRNKLTAIFHLNLHAISLHLKLYFCN